MTRRIDASFGVQTAYTLRSVWGDLVKRKFGTLLTIFSHCRVFNDSNGELFVMEKFTFSDDPILYRKANSQSTYTKI